MNQTKVNQRFSCFHFGKELKVKKAQLTIFIIIAIMLLATIAIMFFLFRS